MPELSSVEQGGGVDAERARLLQHGIHEETIFYTRLNFFLLFESILLGSVIQTATATGMRVRILQIVAVVLGLLVLGVWAYAQWRKLNYLKRLEARLADRLPEMRAIDEGRDGFPEARARSKSANRLITWTVPTFVLIAWVGVVVALRVQ